MKPFTVIFDWDSSQDGEAVLFHVTAPDARSAHEEAERLADTRYGSDAEYLYSVMTLVGHADRVRF
ncbi:hypothetical protein [Streptomyces sp. CBMA29]|uniref:hypothetical protein n=1 Tax=Streptomyces sp. CBMA29 TaxID=1896314 RepID=UPI001661E378|nr:hypothetical protein [Streptomyces sp. CBMA29]MBD0739820.1 hypothetical protein [Streptomyces sp. CBMA29]